MLLKYPLSDEQYRRFQDANNDDQIQELGRKAGVTITDEFVEGGIEKMRFRGRCNGTMALVFVEEAEFLYEPIHCPHWECWIRIQSKPWWLPWFILDWGFREALK
jgi:hypothetical protein